MFIEQMYAFLVTCSYREARRFKASVAGAAVKDSKGKGIVKKLPGLVQVVSDNFDATISSQNGLRSTHSLAVLLTMPDTHDTTADYGTIKRVTTDEMKQAVTVVDGVPVPRFNSPKKPQMPPEQLVPYYRSNSCRTTSACISTPGHTALTSSCFGF